MMPHPLPHRGRRLFPVRSQLMLLALLAAFGGGIGPAWAQLNRSAPTNSYYTAFPEFWDGEYKIALERFESERRGSIKTSQSRWIDSICYETMCGECYYEMGRYPEAVTHYTAAIELYLTFPSWLTQVQFAATMRADPGVKKAIPWATRRMQAPLGLFHPQERILQGSIDATAAVQTGGVVAMAQSFPINPAEIARCTCLAIRRRAQLLGPMAAHDPVFENLIAALGRRPSTPNHWSEAWVNVELGLALSAGGRAAQAIPLLERGTIAQGEFEHPLSAVAHLELGRLAMVQGDLQSAATHFEEASYAAFYFYDPTILEESFRYGAAIHLLANRKGPFPPLTAALAWAKTTRLRQMYCSLLMLAAEGHLVQGQTPQAAELLEEARAAMGHRPMSIGRIGARRNFLGATALFQTHKLPEGETLLAQAMSFMRQGSLWLYHLRLVDEYYTSGASGATAARTALELFQAVLRDPQPGDWYADPMESLAVLIHAHPLAYEHWFDAAVARKEHELALEVADRARRHRFLTTLPMGGRLEALRWVLEAPKEILPKQAVLQRQDLLARYPLYDQLRQEVVELRDKLRGQPLVPNASDDLKQQTQQLTQLAALGHRQEVLLREMAVRREPAVIAFPPLRPTAEIQKALPKGHALLVFFATARGMHGFLLNHDHYSDWQVGVTPVAVGHQTATLLRDMGNLSANHELALKDLAESKWKQTGHDLLDGLLKGSRADFAAKFDELVVVPDGFLWYLPFEALQVEADGQFRPLISRFRVRYAPTASLAYAFAEQGHRPGTTAVTMGRLSPRLEDEVAQTMFADMSRAVPGCVAIHAPLPAPAPIFAGMIDRLVVIDDMAAGSDASPYGWSPLPVERGKSGTTLADWLALPWGGPAEFILPGYHTACEDALKKEDTVKRSGRGAAGEATRALPGNEVFLSVCGMMATGARTVLLSRWRTGGQSSLDLVREFVQELPHTSAAEAWQRAVLVVAGARLNLEAEPRIKHATTDAPLRAAHPFFWAGYLLADCGSPGNELPAAAVPAPAAKPVVPAAKPVLK